MIMFINHPNRVVVVLATTIALVLLVVNTVGATAADVGSGVRQYNTQKYYRGGSVRGVRGSSATNRNRNLNEKTSKSSKLTKSQASDTDVVAPTGRDGNATTTDDDDFSADEFEDENNSTAIIIDTNFTQEEDEDADELDFADDDVPIDDSNATTTTTISNIPTPVFVRTPISNELNPATVGAADGEEEATNDASCSAAPLCTRNGLTGDCCPTSEGVSLACCAKNFGSLPEPAPAAAAVEGED